MRDYFFPYMTLEAANDNGSGSAEESTDEGNDTKDKADIMPDADAETLRSEITKLRNEAAKYRTRSKEYDETKSRLEKLESGLKGIFGEDEDLDPSKLKEKTQNLETQLKTERVKSSVMIEAVNQGLDPDLTIAYLQAQGKLSDIDPSDHESVTEILGKVAENKPALKTTKADKVGTGGGGNDGSNDTPLNPIDAYRKDKGMLQNGK